MLFRFSLYGFLKNQQYFDPFLLLALLEKGLSFTQIGLLIGFRSICINLLEIPTGAIADVAGRRRSMILSFLSYIGSFLIFGLAEPLWALFAAMFLFAIGTAFRTGTHKAMIFDWLARQGRQDEKTKYYGFTRSWSKLGSALSVVIAAGLVFVTGSFSMVFLFCIVPYAMNIVNFLGYPSYLDGPKRESPGLAGVLRTLTGSLREAVSNRPLRRLFEESMCFSGLYTVCKDYLQIAIKTAALSLPLMASYGDTQRTAVLAAPIFLVLYLASSWASRNAHVLAERAGGEAKGAIWLWVCYLVSFGCIGLASVSGSPGFAILPFVFIFVCQDVWRPMIVSRFADHAEPARHATVLSIESQSKSLFAAIAAPLLGFTVDKMPTGMEFLPVGLLGLAVSLVVLAVMRHFRIKASAGQG